MIRKCMMPCIAGRAEEPSVRPLDRLTSVLHHLQHHHHHLQHHHHHLQSLQSPSSLSSLSFVTQYPVARAANQTEPVENSSACHHLVGKLLVNRNVGQNLKIVQKLTFSASKTRPPHLGQPSEAPTMALMLAVLAIAAATMRLPSSESSPAREPERERG